MFREDLYYRLSVIPVRIPPLRERREDIPLLIEYFLKDFNAASAVRFSPEVMKIMQDYYWRGNVRELRNVIERVLVLRKGEVIVSDDLPEEVGSNLPKPIDLILEIPENGVSLDDVEEELLLKALEKNNWNQTKTAKFLKITRATLIYRMEKYDIRKL